MWLITYHAIPKPSSPEFNISGGAYVNCWILFAWQDGAEHLARYEVEKEWIITEKAEISWYDNADDLQEEDDKEHFQQAQVDGGCFVFHVYPLEASESDEDFELDEPVTADERVVKADH